MSESRYTTGFTELMQDPNVADEFRRLEAFLRAALAGLGHRDHEAALEVGLDAFSGSIRPGTDRTEAWTESTLGHDGVELSNQAQLELSGVPVIANYGIVVRDPIPQP